MRLSQLDPKNTAAKALKSNFDFNFDVSKLDRLATKHMIDKVSKLVKEARETPEFYRNQNNPGYMKLIFVAQSLLEHYKSFKNVRIILENEEVEKSQVILAAQDMVDTVQKMVEQTNDMLVKELPALTDSIQSEMGGESSSAFNSSATQALTALNQSVSQCRQALSDALNTLTGGGAGVGAAFAPPTAGGSEMAVTDLAATGSGGAASLPTPVEPEADLELPAEQPDQAAVGGAGRSKR